MCGSSFFIVFKLNSVVLPKSATKRGTRLMVGRQRVHIHNLSRYNGNRIVVIAVRFCAPDKKNK